SPTTGVNQRVRTRATLSFSTQSPPTYAFGNPQLDGSRAPKAVIRPTEANALRHACRPQQHVRQVFPDRSCGIDQPLRAVAYDVCGWVEVSLLLSAGADFVSSEPNSRPKRLTWLRHY